MIRKAPTARPVRRVAERGARVAGTGSRVLAVGVDLGSGGAAAPAGAQRPGAPTAAARAAGPGEASASDGALEAREVRGMAGRLLAPLAHDLRSGLTGILGWTQVLERVADEATRVRALEGIRRAVTQQTRLAEDVAQAGKTLASADDRVPVQVDLTAALRTAIAENAASAGAREITVDFEDEAATTLVVGDPAQLQQLARMLVIDALAQVPMSTPLSVSLRERGDAVIVEFSSPSVDLGALPGGAAAAPSRSGVARGEPSRAGGSSADRRPTGNIRRSIASLIARLHGGDVVVAPGGDVLLRASLRRTPAPAV